LQSNRNKPVGKLQTVTRHILPHKAYSLLRNVIQPLEIMYEGCSLGLYALWIQKIKNLHLLYKPLLD